MDVAIWNAYRGDRTEGQENLSSIAHRCEAMLTKPLTTPHSFNFETNNELSPGRFHDTLVATPETSMTKHTPINYSLKSLVLA
jgi:hypothetical protein